MRFLVMAAMFAASLAVVVPAKAGQNLHDDVLRISAISRTCTHELLLNW